MHKKKFFAKLVLASVLTGGINFLPAVPIFHAGNFQVSVAHAEIKTFAAKNTAMTDVESLTNAAKSTAQERALNLAQKKAETFLKTLSPTLRGRLTDEDISAVVINNFKIVNAPLYRKLYYQAVDENGNDLGRNGEIYEATVTINIDTAALDKYRKLGAQDREKLIKQAQNAQAAFEEIDRDFEELRKNARTKSPKQLQADINKFDAKISKAEKSRKKNQSATPPAIVQDKPAITENKPAPPVTNQPMQFSQPVEIGGFGWSNLHGGVVITGASYVSETPIKHGKSVARWEYSKGTARFGDGKEAVYLHYAQRTNFRIGSNDINGTLVYNDMWATILKVSAKNGYTMYFLKKLFDAPAPSYHYILIGQRPDGKWVKYFNTEDLCKQYFGKSKNVSIQKVTSNGDSIILKYARSTHPSYAMAGYFYEKEADEFGEFRFKWDEKAQWFSVEKITY